MGFDAGVIDKPLRFEAYERMDVELELGNHSSENFDALEEAMNDYLEGKQRIWTKPCHDAIEKKLFIDWYFHFPTTAKHLPQHLDEIQSKPSFKPLYDALIPNIQSCFASHQNWQTSISAIESFNCLNFPSDGSVSNLDVLLYFESEKTIQIDSIDIEADILRFSSPNQKLDVSELAFNPLSGRLQFGQQYWDFPANSIERDLVEVLMDNTSSVLHWDEIAVRIESQFEGWQKEQQAKYKRTIYDAVLRIQRKIGANKLFHWENSSVITKIEH